MQSAIIWDLETVPDIDLMAAALKTTTQRAKELSKLEFPRLPYHTIVCIGAVVCIRSSAGWNIESIGAPSIIDRTEADLVRSFLARIEDLKPQLITFNGSSFDLPVLRYRAMTHKLGSGVFQSKAYYNRYTDDAIDLCDVLASYDNRAKVSLDVSLRAMGLGSKPTGISGADVENYVASGRIREVAEYCESDVVSTFRLWLRYERFRGTLSDLELEASENNLRQYVLERIALKPHLAALLQLE